MRAVRIVAPGEVEIAHLPDPRPGPGEVLVRITAAGICGTDLHLYEGRFGSFPLIPGHDVAGVIAAAGTGAPAARVGERVTIDPAGCCARAAEAVDPCPACRRGATHLCRSATYMGISAPGAMAELIAVAAARAVPLCADVDDATATALEPVAVALHLLEQVADRPGAALVIGGGPIGIVAGLLLAAGGRAVRLVEPLANRRRLAAEMGLAAAAAPESIDGPVEEGLIVETSGHPSAEGLIARAAAPGSTIVLVGGDTTVPGHLVLTRELEVRAAKGGRGLYPEAIDLAAAGRIAPGRLVSHRFAAAEAARAFATASRRRDIVTRAVLDMTAW
jgi:2-desacetyl-2-hydroxyethyl bacteriochlorophyllide A dehydrogenase